MKTKKWLFMTGLLSFSFLISGTCQAGNINRYCRIVSEMNISCDEAFGTIGDYMAVLEKAEDDKSVLIEIYTTLYDSNATSFVTTVSLYNGNTLSSSYDTRVYQATNGRYEITSSRKMRVLNGVRLTAQALFSRL